MGDTLLEEEGSVEMERVEEVKGRKKEKESRFGKRWSRAWFYEALGLFHDYRVQHYRA